MELHRSCFVDKLGTLTVLGLVVSTNYGDLLYGVRDVISEEKVLYHLYYDTLAELLEATYQKMEKHIREALDPKQAT